MVDAFSLQIEERRNEIGSLVYETVSISVNGRDLTDILKEVEMPFAQQEGTPNIAGGYEGLRPEEIFLPSRRLLGEPESGTSGEKVAVLGCECGEIGCWPFLVSVTVRNEVVIWSDFEQPHRSGRASRQPWIYDRLRPFLFDRARYLAELEKG
jgi:hypothetical protein